MTDASSSDSEEEGLISKEGNHWDFDDGFLKKCCIGCCTCCCIFLPLLAILLVWALVLGAPGGRYIPIGVNTVTLGYMVDMISLLSGKGVPSYADSWCGGVDKLGTCDIKLNFPGPDTTSYMSWDDVWAMGSKYPEKEWSGEWWRGNELGFIINVPRFWSHMGINPMSIALGITPKQHWAIRPIMESMWTIGDPPGPMSIAPDGEPYRKAETIVRRRVREFLSGRETFATTDVTVLTHLILNEIGLQRNISWEDAQQFVAVQTSVVGYGTVGHLIPGFLMDKVLGPTTDNVRGYVNEYVGVMDKLYGSRMRDDDCSPSENCSVQAATGTWDALYAAGGLSVPGAINTALGVLYSTDAGNPAPGLTYEKDQALAFYWESIRFFPPVVGFPHWETRPTCSGSSAEETAKLNKSAGQSEPCKLGSDTGAGYPKVNQYLGGTRHVPNLAIAQSDPRKWGPDAGKFVIRPVENYTQNSVGFAEMAVNNYVAGGRMNRVCPGKALALMIGTTFFEEFDKERWASSDPITWKGTTPFVSAFTLTKKKEGSSSSTLSYWGVVFSICLQLPITNVW
mmetsp:Transcript_107996/g.214542  ORF Transcript_107996/g.214542 Transcript_107996/m.214542 type:complete len:567 (-) Transcript_107996:236-1936(-)